MRSIEEIEEELRLARRAQADETKRRREAVKPRYEYVIAPTTGYSHDRCYDPAVVLYRVESICLNMAECVAAGHSEQNLRQGGMTYYFNTATGRIITSTGGGHLHIESFDDVEESTKCIAEVSEFLVAHPEGGEITDIVERFNAAVNR